MTSWGQRRRLPSNSPPAGRSGAAANEFLSLKTNGVDASVPLPRSIGLIRCACEDNGCRCTTWGDASGQPANCSGGASDAAEPYMGVKVRPKPVQTPGASCAGSSDCRGGAHRGDGRGLCTAPCGGCRGTGWNEGVHCGAGSAAVSEATELCAAGSALAPRAAMTARALTGGGDIGAARGAGIVEVLRPPRGSLQERPRACLPTAGCTCVHDLLADGDGRRATPETWRAPMATRTCSESSEGAGVSVRGVVVGVLNGASGGRCTSRIGLADRAGRSATAAPTERWRCCAVAKRCDGQACGAGCATCFAQGTVARARKPPPALSGCDSTRASAPPADVGHTVHGRCPMERP